MAIYTDIEFLVMIVQLDANLRTTGYIDRRDGKFSIIRKVRALEDNGFDTVVGAMLRGYGVDRATLDDPDYSDEYAERLEEEHS